MLEGKIWNIVKTDLIDHKILKSKITNFDQSLLSQDDKKVNLAIQNYCFNLRAQLEQAVEFRDQRKLLLTNIKKTLLFNNKVILFGTIELSEINKLDFQIERNITGTDRSRWVSKN